MKGKKGYILVEGHGEVEAAQNLVVRLSRAAGFHHPWATPLRWINLHHWESDRGGVRKGAEFVRMKKDAGALLFIKDEDDDCPKITAPTTSEKLQSLELPFPTAYVLLRPEYEVLFLPCIDRMGFPDGTVWDAPSWEYRRGIKEWLSSKYPPGRRYKPTVDQLRMTQRIDFEVLRSADVPSFGSLERALFMIGQQFGNAGPTYPPLQ